MTNEATPVLIVGAGPTGLVLALWLAKLGIKVRLIDKASEPGTTSRALVVHARTLEFYSQIGIVDSFLSQGLKFSSINLWVGGKRRAHVPIADIGIGMSPYPFLLISPQDQHENILIERLKRFGVKVERNTELVGFQQTADFVTAKLKKPDGSEEVCLAQYLAGCDGAKSFVREHLGTGFPGGTYPSIFYVADIEGEGSVFNQELNIAIDSSDFLGVFPMKEKNHVRLVGAIQVSAEKEEKFRWEDVSSNVIRTLNLDIKNILWFSTYHVHHRVTSHFREGRVFLLGDAAHIHSPVGGQGMNTGIGDAVNLSWKLQAVLDGRVQGIAEAEKILDSYEIERIAFAKNLVNTTDRAFRIASSQGLFAKFVRTLVVPFVMPRLFAIESFRRWVFRKVSQISISYRHCSYNEGQAGATWGGDRLPWFENNFSPLQSLDWQIHIYGKISAAKDAELQELNLPLHIYPWDPAMHNQGLQMNVAYVIRPDGHIGSISNTADPAEIKKYFQERGLQFEAQGMRRKSSMISAEASGK